MASILRLPGRSFSRRVLFAALVLLAACTSNDKPDTERYVERPVDEIYNQAVDTLQTKDYEAAAKLFDDVERQHPYSVWATKAQMW